MTATLPDLDREIEYTTRWGGQTSKCRLRAWNGPRIALVTQLADSPGPSVTNAAEDVAHAVEQTLALKRTARPHSLFDSWTMIEHYPANSERGHTFDVVTFADRDREHRPTGPRWSPAKLNDDLHRAVVPRCSVCGNAEGSRTDGDDLLRDAGISTYGLVVDGECEPCRTGRLAIEATRG